MAPEPLLSARHRDWPLGWMVTQATVPAIIFVCLFVCLFLAALGLRCCVRAFSSCGEQGLLFVAARRLLIAVASLVVEHRL